MAPRINRTAGYRNYLIGLILAIMPTVTHGGQFQPTEFQVSSRGLVIQGDPYGRSLPMVELQREGASVVDLEQEPRMRPWLKLNGIGIPGYRSGWHRLKGRETVLVFLSRSRRVVYIPTTRGVRYSARSGAPGRISCGAKIARNKITCV